MSCSDSVVTLVSSSRIARRCSDSNSVSDSEIEINTPYDGGPVYISSWLACSRALYKLASPYGFPIQIHVTCQGKVAVLSATVRSVYKVLIWHRRGRTQPPPPPLGEEAAAVAHGIPNVRSGIIQSGEC
ncbi:hypothetical protein CBL_10727 [Carabus blaptoides fortunei]